MWNVTLEYTATHFNVLGKTCPGNPFPDLPHTPTNAQLYDTDMVVVSQELGRKYRSAYQLGLEPGTCGVRIQVDPL